MTCIRARLDRPLKKSEQEIPRGLKAARDDKNKRLIGTTEVVPCHKATFQRLVKPDTSIYETGCKC